MFLDYFPIKYRNFSKMFVPLKITSLGITNVDFGFTTLDNVSIKILEFSKFKLIEFRKKEFRIAIDSEDDLFEYEIFKNIKNPKQSVAVVNTTAEAIAGSIFNAFNVTGIKNPIIQAITRFPIIAKNTINPI